MNAGTANTSMEKYKSRLSGSSYCVVDKRVKNYIKVKRY